MGLTCLMSLFSMTYGHKQRVCLLILMLVYSLLFYFMFTDQIKLDFYSFYSSSAALLNKSNPYQVLSATYLPIVKKLSANLNPPIVLMLFMPLAQVSHHLALAIWCGTSMMLGLVSATVAFKLAFTRAFFREHWLSLYMIYLALFSTLMNAHIAQLGTFTAFCLIVGYYLYQHKHETLAGVLWGVIISIKIFPGLLFLYVLRRGSYQMLWTMACTVLLMCLIPYLVYGIDIYSSYLNMLPRVLWYGDSWNASIYGFLFRAFVDTHAPDNVRWVHALYVLLCLGCIAWYLKKIITIKTTDDKHHQQFCLTLVVMLLLSPLGWMYYFPLILLPLLITWSQVTQPHTHKRVLLTWFVCLFLINFPIDYIETKNMVSLMEKLTVCSFYFYGLLVLAYLLSKKSDAPVFSSEKTDYMIVPITMILGFGIVILGISFMPMLSSVVPAYGSG